MDARDRWFGIRGREQRQRTEAAKLKSKYVGVGDFA